MSSACVLYLVAALAPGAVLTTSLVSETDLVSETGLTLAAGDASPPHSLGACGAPMTGADGQSYPCAPDRKPACNETGARCVCLEQLDCGGARDEPY